MKLPECLHTFIQPLASLANLGVGEFGAEYKSLYYTIYFSPRTLTKPGLSSVLFLMGPSEYKVSKSYLG